MARPAQPTPAQLAQYVAILIDDAAAAYQMFATSAPSIMRSGDDASDHDMFAALRDLGRTVSVTMANANRLIDEVMSRHPAVPSADDPKYLQNLMRALEESFVLLIDIETRQDLVGRPLLHPKTLSSAMEKDVVRKWIDLNKFRRLEEGPLVVNETQS